MEQHSIYWTNENPHEVKSQKFNVSEICVWDSIWYDHIFLENTVTGDRYVNMLRETVSTGTE